MRDPKRIPELLDKMGQLWMSNPDYRATQMLHNAAHYGGWQGGNDLYNCEDSVIIRGLDKMIIDALEKN